MPTAFAKLQGKDWSYYIQNLVVIIGRNSLSLPEVDVHLGNSKSVSRKHAIIFYNFSAKRFEIKCFGKSGIIINHEKFNASSNSIPLASSTLLQIAQYSFFFLLPKENLLQIEPLLRQQVKNNLTEGECSPKNTNEDQEQKRNEKPSYSYTSLIAQAICAHSDNKRSLSSILKWIETNYPYYKTIDTTWQNSVRHALSFNKCFIKIPRTDKEPGKGAFWAIDPAGKHDLLASTYVQKKRKSSQSSTQDGDARKRSNKRARK